MPPNGGKELYDETETYITFYNFERGHQSLNRRTPAEVFFGKKPISIQLNIRLHWFKIGGKLKALNNLKGKALCFNVLGNYYNNKSNRLEATKAFEKSLELALEVNDKLIMLKNYKYLSSLYLELGRNEKGAEYLESGLTIASRIKDYFELAALYNTKGKLYRLQDRNLEALNMFKLSYETYGKAGTKINQAIIKNNIGIMLVKIRQRQRSFKRIGGMFKNRIIDWVAEPNCYNSE